MSNGDGQNLGKSASFAILSAISVILPRIVSFILRGSLIRLVGMELLGVLFVRLELLSTTILFFSREALRKASVSGKFLIFLKIIIKKSNEVSCILKLFKT